MAEELVFDVAPDELEIFLEDVNESLQIMEHGILQLEQESDPETLNSIFRAAHTLKALAGTVGHRPMAELTHALESLFDEMREGRLAPNAIVADELLAAVDVIKILRDEIISRQSAGVDVSSLLNRLELLQQPVERSEETAAASSGELRLTQTQLKQLKKLQQAGQAIFEIHLKAASGAFAAVARLYQATTTLMEIGQVVVQQPALDDLSEGTESVWLILATHFEVDEVLEILADIENIAEADVQPYIPSSPATKNPPVPVNSQPSVGLDKTVRISVERLDTMMNLVGELVTGRTRLLQIEEMLRAQYGKSGAAAALSDLAAPVSHVINQLQEEVMRARMLPIASLFNKFPRLVRDAARQAGKQVDLVIEGEATELDRAVIEAIDDSLIHLLRNAVDHGIEKPAARQAAGKEATGTLHLTAASVEGQIVITVADDGRGLNPAQIRQAALTHNLLSEEEAAQLADDEIIDLIFQPKLSTAGQVTEMSGRGVGLDVVRTNIERLSGSVLVSSQPGQGTTFQLTLPLTLALIQTMLVIVRGVMYAIPVTGINGALYMAEATLNSVRGRLTLDWQGETTVPLLDLRSFFDHADLPANGRKPSIVLVNWGKHRVGLVVDKIIGQQEIVVKSLSPLIGQVSGLSGATILGDGRIALIVDIPGLINAALRARR